MGRPSDYSPEIAESILSLLIDGKSLRQICAADDMPDRSTVLRWLAADADFAARYARAREMQGDHMDDLILETANDCTAENAPAARVKIDAYKWRASKLNPKRYGDKTLIGSDPENPLPPMLGVNVAVLSDEQLRALGSIPDEDK